MSFANMFICHNYNTLDHGKARLILLAENQMRVENNLKTEMPDSACRKA